LFIYLFVLKKQVRKGTFWVSNGKNDYKRMKKGKERRRKKKESKRQKGDGKLG
jgi:hypothetical protein